MTVESQFGFLQGQDIFLFSAMSKPLLGPTQPAITCVPQDLSWWVSNNMCTCSLTLTNADVRVHAHMRVSTHTHMHSGHFATYAPEKF
jgi:hypothetical protein